MNEKTANIDNFIGVYDNYITEHECKKAIRLFDNENKFKRTLNRQNFESAPLLEKKDEQYFANSETIEMWHSELKTLIVNFDMALKHYEQNTGIKEAFGVENFHYNTFKIQKTSPTEGYHIWHIEHNTGYDHEKRALAFSVYLNDVKDGGETEFLHFSKRVKPKTGRIVIWPASFPYVHRGNPPLSNNKYILTSWLMLR